MKIHVELFLEPHERLNELFNVLETSYDFLERDLNSESRLKNETQQEWFVIILRNEYECRVYFSINKNGYYYITNILCDSFDEINISHYNEVVRTIYNIIEPLAKDFQINVEITNDNFDIYDQLKKETAEKLKKFFLVVNPSSVIAHPQDAERWFDFIISYVENDDDLDSDLLYRWCLEEENWSEDNAMELAMKFDEHTALLKKYKNKINYNED